MSIILKPIVTEKMTKITEKLGRVGFLVDVAANKIEIKKAVEEMYNVKVLDVNTLNHPGKKKARYTKAGFVQGRTNATKKAFVTLGKGETIDFYSSI
ncbi:MAG: 50S ribosomal protein L23 [Bacteroidales bacterium]|jgi:large subunit ribosomal protein L23|nr:50S ribosomal protein L23 [Bacteroidales bacterium]